MFEVNGTYENRKGVYTVLSITGRKMKVRFEDGSVADLKMSLQERIWENIVAERDAAEAAAESARRKAKSALGYYIKTLSISEDNDLSIPGLKQRMAAASKEVKLGVGARLIYYAVEAALYFALATVVAPPKSGRAKDYMFAGNPKDKINVYPIDVDAHIEHMELAIPVDAIELESLPNHHETLSVPHQYFTISEDDFELLAELVAEVGEADGAAAGPEADAADEEMELEIEA